ncbi:MAG: DUF1854 domain-containing protein [Eubacteriales bacterium]
MAFFIDGPEAKLIRTGDTTLELRVFAGEVYTNLEPRRLFPLSGLTKYITLLDGELKEKAIIRDIENLDPASREAVEGCLEEYYMIPKITSVLSITEKNGVITWSCNTDRGMRSFRIKNRHSDIKVLYDGRVLVRDSNDNRYEIDNIAELDKHSRRLLANEL